MVWDLTPAFHMGAWGSLPGGGQTVNWTSDPEKKALHHRGDAPSNQPDVAGSLPPKEWNRSRKGWYT